jgi:hypothetical protein
MYQGSRLRIPAWLVGYGRVPRYTLNSSMSAAMIRPLHGATRLLEWLPTFLFPLLLALLFSRVRSPLMLHVVPSRELTSVNSPP